MSLKLNSSGGGSVTLQEPTTASNITLNLPAENSTVVYQNASGNVGIGTISPSTQLHMTGAAFRIANDASVVQFYNTANTTRTGYIQFQPSAAAAINVEVNHALTFGTNNTERARIDSSGNLLLNTTSASVTNRAATFNVNNIASRDTLGLKQDANTLFNICSLVSTTSGTRYHIGFGDGTTFTERGTISTNGTSTTYSTSSDYRLKENITPMSGALIKVAQMRPVNWTWKENGAAGQGFIAHELQAVIPDAVVGQKDEVDENGTPRFQSVDTSFLVATLTAAIQEQQAMIEELKAKVAALEAK